MNKLHYYVYYKIEPAKLATLLGATAALFDEMRAATGVQGRLQRRRDDPGTWMEVYENVADSASFEHALEVALAKTEFSDLKAQRKTEIFQCA